MTDLFAIRLKMWTLLVWCDLDLDVGDGQRMAERYEPGGGLGGHDAGHLGHGHHVPLLQARLGHQSERLLALRRGGIM